MESFGNEIKVRQGETWSLDMELFADSQQTVPFIVGSERHNPYFVVTIASTKYEKNLRYVKSWWNSVTDGSYKNPTFYDTHPEYYGEISDKLTITENTTINNGSTIKPGSTLKVGCIINGTSVAEEQITTTVINITENSTLVSGSIIETGSRLIINGNIIDVNVNLNLPTIEEMIHEETYSTRCLYYYTVDSEKIDKTIGHKPYHYFYLNYELNELGVPVATSIHDGYSCHLRFDFLAEDTKDWCSQNYMYQITLVSGDLMNIKIDKVYANKRIAGWNGEGWPTSNENYEQFKFIKTMWPDEFQPDIDEDSPLGTIDAPEVVLQPTKLEVYNNLKTLI